MKLSTLKHSDKLLFKLQEITQFTLLRTVKSPLFRDSLQLVTIIKREVLLNFGISLQFHHPKNNQKYHLSFMSILDYDKKLLDIIDEQFNATMKESEAVGEAFGLLAFNENLNERISKEVYKDEV